MTDPLSLTRRNFLQTSAAAGAVASLPASVLAGAAGANDRLNIAIVGVGTRGGQLMTPLVEWASNDTHNIRVTRVSEIYTKRLDRGLDRVAKAGGKAEGARDYRAVLDDKDVDLVVVATPDHWHHKIASEALKAGKHVYCEKPMCHTIDQAKDLVKVVGETGKKLQVGVQGTSLQVADKIREHIQKNGIGKLVLAQSSLTRNNVAGQWRDYGEYDADAKPGPDLDWDQFLGHQYGLAPKRDWHAPRYFQYRCYWDYSGGVATDLFFHQLAFLVKAMGVGMPRQVVAAGGIYCFGEDSTTPQGAPDDRENPDLFNMFVDYPGGPTVTLLGSQVNDVALTELIGGHDATIIVDRKNDSAQVIPQKSIGRIKETITLKGDGAMNERVHFANLFDAIRDGAALNCPVELGYKVNVPIAMGVMAYRQKTAIGWDAKGEKAVPASTLMDCGCEDE
ncbi:Gfo/Idh/MocA family oxidoreductase [Tundrisphaera lichenicola]|uniref:Gfo/Idh/MocA family oxidoreductase n=1 Tax=Tundrisphaera lichenicola TaxID=2029860 RepID=UPI003EBF8881